MLILYKVKSNPTLSNEARLVLGCTFVRRRLLGDVYLPGCSSYPTLSNEADLFPTSSCWSRIVGENFFVNQSIVSSFPSGFLLSLSVYQPGCSSYLAFFTTSLVSRTNDIDRAQKVCL